MEKFLSMKVLLLADINSSHSRKWIEGLLSKQVTVAVVTLAPDFDEKVFPTVKIYSNSKEALYNKGLFSKLQYLTSLPLLKRAIREFQPDVLHAHYATSYGLLGALTSFRPFLISVWGSDIMSFPHSNFLLKLGLKWVLNRADRILVTSKVLHEHVIELSQRPVEIIPFGVDLKKFCPDRPFTERSLNIGCVKSLEHIYGIDILIKAFAQVVKQLPAIDLKLVIAGTGTQAESLKSLTEELNIKNKVKFVGRIEHTQVPAFLNQLYLLVNVSRNESFGVSVLEASACNIPVIATKIGGIKEVVVNEETGYLVPVEDVSLTAEAIIKLVTNPSLAERFGTSGRNYVAENYDWDKCLDKMMQTYNNCINR